MKKVFCLLVVLILLATTGCSLENDAYKNKYAQEFIQEMEEMKEAVPEDCKFDYEVKNTIKGKAKASMCIEYNDHKVEMIFTFDSWESIENLEGIDEQELFDKGIITVKIDGVKYKDCEAAEALMDVYLSY